MNKPARAKIGAGPIVGPRTASPVSQQAEEQVQDGDRNDGDFQRLAVQRPRGIVAEFIDFLREEKRWWLAPIVFVLLVISLFIVLTNTAIGPFIYVLF